VNQVEVVRPRLVWQTRPIHHEPRPDDWAWLGEEDLARAAAITHPSAMARFVAARALLRELLAVSRPDLDPARLRIDSEPSGRPYVAGQPHLHVSISHTDGLAAAAVAPSGPIGIDVERLDRRDLPPPRMWLAPAELPALTRIDAELRQLALLHRWVAKEAAIKAHPYPQLAQRLGIVLTCEEGHRGASHVGERTHVRRAGDVADARATEEQATWAPAPAHASTPSGAPSYASWCGNGLARLDLSERRSDASPSSSSPSNGSQMPADGLHGSELLSSGAAPGGAPHGADPAGSASSTDAAAEDPSAVGEPTSQTRSLTIDWYAMADQFLVAVAMPIADGSR
jgi:4'-phosphopantetheinyl transferase EntD